MKMSEATFEKHIYGRTKKRKNLSLENFDPRPPQYQGTAISLMPNLLHKVCGKGLCISLLLDPSTQHWRSSVPTEASFSMPEITQLQQTIQELKTA